MIFGSGATVHEVARSGGEMFPALRAMAETYGSTQIRNLATLGGNLATASPVGDSIPLLLAYDAMVHLEGPEGRREIPLREFIVGYRKTALRTGEIIAAIAVRRPPPRTQIRFYKISKRKDVDIATLSAGFRVTLDDRGTVAEAMIAYGGMDALPRRAPRLESALTGRPWDEQAVREAQKAVTAEFQPISDVRGSKTFRLTAARNLLELFYQETKEGGAG